MSKLIAQAFLSLMVSLGLVTGVNPDVRGEVKQAWQETKAIVHQTVDFATETATNLAPQVNVNVNAEAGADANTDVYFDEDSQSGTEVGTEAQADTSAEAQAESEGGFFLNFGGDASSGLNIGFGK